MSRTSLIAAHHVVIDTSAALGIITSQPGGPDLARAIERAPRRSMSAATLVELAFILEAQLGPAGRGIAERFVTEAEIDIVIVDRATSELAIHGCYRYGNSRTRGLDLGHCFTYALAASLDNAAVLCTGDEFDETDIEVVRI